MTALEGHPFPWRVHGRTFLAAAGPLMLVAAWHSGTIDGAWIAQLFASAWNGDAAVAATAIAIYVGLQFTLPGPTSLRFRLRDDGPTG